MRLLTAVTLTLFTLITVGAAGARQQPQAQGQSSAAEDLNALNKRVRELYEAKKYEEAAKAAQAAVEAAERQFGPDSSEAGQALLNLANIMAARRRPDEARKAMTRLVELREKRPGAPQPSEREALELFTCLDASDTRAKPDPELHKRIHRLLVEDSLLEQGYKLPADRAGLKLGELLRKPQPQYPIEALSVRASGSVVLRITIDEEGRVVDANPLACSQRMLVKPAAEAASRARFDPTLVDGKPVMVRSIIIYRFVIQ
jgi:TonB family protein